MRKLEGGILYSAPPTEIIVPEDRIRKEFNAKKLRELADSIKGRKQDTPGICYLNEEGKPVLVAGERRLRACEIAEVEFTFRLESETDPLIIYEIELEENLQRVNLTFQEEAEALYNLHALKQKLFGEAGPGSKTGWSEKKTAKHLERSVGSVHEDLELAMFIKAFPEVAKAPNKTEAKKIIKRLKEEHERTIALDKALEVAEDIPDRDTEAYAAAEEADRTEELIRHYSKFVHKGSMEEIFPTLPDEEFDVVIFDPPWGVGYDKNKVEVGSQKDYEDDPEVFDENIERWLHLIWTKMKPDSHLYLFFGMAKMEETYAALERVGFVTNRIPIIWYKAGAGRTRNPDVWLGRAYEPIAYARKGNKKLVIKGSPDVITTPVVPRLLKKNHPSAKHPMIIEDLLKKSAYPGDKILDPMCGSGMTGVACEHLKKERALSFTMIEKDPDFYALAIANLVAGYNQIVLKTDSPHEYSEKQILPEVPPIPEDYKTLEPATHEWKRFWNAHPELQDEMLAWKARKES